jgi:hypothetical protein
MIVNRQTTNQCNICLIAFFVTLMGCGFVGEYQPLEPGNRALVVNKETGVFEGEKLVKRGPVFLLAHQELILFNMMRDNNN